MDSHKRVENSEKILQTWTELWESGFSKNWLSDSPNPHLWKYMDHLRFDGEGIFFVPCCGNTVDLKMLYEEGFKVVGVEIYEKAVHNFFQEKNINFVKNPVLGQEGFIEYATPDRRLRIFVGDIFNFSADLVGGPVLAVWDRGSLTVMQKDTRKRYVSIVTELLEGGASYLFECFQFNDWYTEKVPKNFPEELIADLLEPHFHVKFLASEPFDLDVLQVPAKRSFYLMNYKK